MVKRAAQCTRSSYPATAGQVAAPAWLDADWVRGQFGVHNPKLAYERFVAQGLGQASPWDNLQGQIWLGSAAFLNRMGQLAQAVPMANVPQRQRHPARPTATAVTAQVLSAYRIKDEKALRTRANQEAFRAWVYLLRRVVNLPLQEVANRSKVSPSRISKIQRAMEASELSKPLLELLDKCKVRN